MRQVGAFAFSLLWKVRQCLARAFSPLLSGTRRTELRNTRALAMMRVIIAPCSSPVRLFAPRTRLVGRSAAQAALSPSFLLRGARDQRNERSEEQTRWWPRRDLSSHRQVHTERGIHGAGDEPHCPIPLITGLEYKAAPDGAVHLPPPDIRGHDSHPFEWVVYERRCRRDFAELPSGHLHLWEIAQLSWAAQGITAPETAPDEFGHAGWSASFCSFCSSKKVEKNHLSHRSPHRRASRRTAPSGDDSTLSRSTQLRPRCWWITPGPQAPPGRKLPRCFRLVPSARPSGGEVNLPKRVTTTGEIPRSSTSFSASTVPQVARLKHQS